MRQIIVKNASVHHLKNVNVRVPLDKFVVIVGKSGSGKSSFVYDVLYRASQGESVQATVSKMPRTFLLEQKVKPISALSLGETNFARLRHALAEAKKGDLLIVDEPCAGMAHEDCQAVISELKKAVKKGISVIAVEHSRDVILNADYIIEFGPEAGAGGGYIVFQGSLAAFKKAKTITADCVFSKRTERVDVQTRTVERKKSASLVIKGINRYALRNLNVSIPLNALTCVTGRHGTGKSTLLSVVYGALFKGAGAWEKRQGFKTIEGKQHVRRSYFVDQSPLGSSAVSTPATLLGVWDVIRDVFATLPESKKSKFTKSSFAFRLLLQKKDEARMRKVKYKNFSIYDVLDLTVDRAVEIFSACPLVVRKLGFLQTVGLGYLTLGQTSNTLSGGEAQRVRLAKILSKKLGDRCVFILDTPSRGLHLSDLPTLISVFQKIIAKHNTILIAENREEIVQRCDEVIAL